MIRAPLPAALGLLLLAGCQQSSAPVAAPPRPTSVPTPVAAPAAAVRITRVDLGNAIAGDQRVVAPMIQFAPNDRFHAAITLAGSDGRAHRIGVRWTHLDSRQTVLEEGKSLLLQGDTVTAFRLEKADGWPPGKYKLEVLLDGKLAQTRLFDVRLP